MCANGYVRCVLVSCTGFSPSHSHRFLLFSWFPLFLCIQAKNVETGEMVAIKIVRKDFLDSKPSLRKKMRREISVLKLLSHPNVMSLIDVFEIETHLFLVMEFVDGLELFEFLVRRGALPPQEALAFFQQIICGLEYCHRRLIVHRDLKPENLLLDRQLQLKIADFGMTSLNKPGSKLETSCGSPHYCDPMVVSGERYDGLKADIWSCGVILYAMVTGRLPFDDDNLQRLLLKVQAGQFHLPSDLPDDLRDLIKKMLTVDPEERIDMAGIKAHPWFQSSPPKNYPEDDFEASADPIYDADRGIVASLSDLGLGDSTSIMDHLAQPGRSIEKVFYVQLSRHPLFSRSFPTGGTHAGTAPVGAAPPGALPSRPAATGPAARLNEPSAAPVSTDTSTGSTPPTNAEPVPSPGPPPGAVHSGGPPVARVGDTPEGAKTGNGEENNGVSMSSSWPVLADGKGSKLVRQVEFNRSASNVVENPEDDQTVEEAIQGGEQKSWFPALLDTLSGRGGGRQSPQGDEGSS